MVSIDNNTGYIRALVGGLDFERSSFNRAVQAVRQPGSAFKPMVYAAALEWADYSPHTLIVDEPIAVMVDPAKPPWIPRNADGQFLGPITLKQALAQSRNIAAVKLIMDISPERTIHMARKMGIRSSLDKNLSLSLGSSEVTPLELTSAYTVFPNMGLRISPVLIKRVEDRFGNVLEDNSMEPLDIAAHLKDELSSHPGKLMTNMTEDPDINGEMSDPERRIPDLSMNCGIWPLPRVLRVPPPGLNIFYQPLSRPDGSPDALRWKGRLARQRRT